MASRKDNSVSSYDHKQYLGLSRSRLSHGSDEDDDKHAPTSSNNVNVDLPQRIFSISSSSFSSSSISDMEVSSIEDNGNKTKDDPYIIPGIAFMHTTKDFRPAMVQNDVLFNQMVKPSLSLSTPENTISSSTSSTISSLHSSTLAPWITNIPSTRLSMDESSLLLNHRIKNDQDTSYLGPYPSLTKSVVPNNNTSNTNETTLRTRHTSSTILTKRTASFSSSSIDDNDEYSSMDSRSVEDITNPSSMTLHLSDLINPTTQNSHPSSSTLSSSLLPNTTLNTTAKPLVSPSDKLLNIDTLTSTIRTTQGAGRYFFNGSRLGGTGGQRFKQREELKCFRCKQTGHFAMNCPNEAIKGSGKCFICADPDHESPQCPEADICFICDENGHRVANCPHRQTIEKQIEINGRPFGYGHYLSMLIGPMEATARLIPDHWPNKSEKRYKFYELLANPQYPKAEVLSLQYCHACGSSAHSTTACPLSANDMQFVQCCVCGRMGHSFCTTDTTNVTFPYSVNPPEKSSHGRLGTCFSCGEKSHYGHQCTKRNRYATLSVGPPEAKSSVHRMEFLQEEAMRTINSHKKSTTTTSSHSSQPQNKRRRFEESSESSTDTESDSSLSSDEDTSDDDDSSDSNDSSSNNDDDDDENSTSSDDDSSEEDSSSTSESTSNSRYRRHNPWQTTLCYNCQQYGHRSVDCPRPRKNHTSSSSSNQGHKYLTNSKTGTNNHKNSNPKNGNNKSTPSQRIVTDPNKQSSSPKQQPPQQKSSKSAATSSSPPSKRKRESDTSPKSKNQRTSSNNSTSSKSKSVPTTVAVTASSSLQPREPWYERDPQAKKEWARVRNDQHLTEEGKRALLQQLRKQVKKDEKKQCK